jgi:hypothetical protein
MGAEISDGRDGVVVIKLSGTLSQSVLEDVQKRTADIIVAQGKIRLLVLAEQFAGWEAGGAWDDFSFQENCDPSIEKMAIVVISAGRIWR